MQVDHIPGKYGVPVDLHYIWKLATEGAHTTLVVRAALILVSDVQNETYYRGCWLD
jgi:hypothetical protein